MAILFTISIFITTSYRVLCVSHLPLHFNNVMHWPNNSYCNKKCSRRHHACVNKNAYLVELRIQRSTTNLWKNQYKMNNPRLLYHSFREFDVILVWMQCIITTSFRFLFFFVRLSGADGDCWRVSSDGARTATHAPPHRLGLHQRRWNYNHSTDGCRSGTPGVQLVHLGPLLCCFSARHVAIRYIFVHSLWFTHAGSEK